MIENYKSINNFFTELVDDLKCHQDTKSYIVGIYTKYQTANFDLSQDNITLLFAQARYNQNFSKYQIIGDWIFYYNTFIHNKNKNYYDNIAQSSYYSCYKLINKQWKLFEQLSDELPQLEDHMINKLNFK